MRKFYRNFKPIILMVLFWFLFSLMGAESTVAMLAALVGGMWGILENQVKNIESRQDRLFDRLAENGYLDKREG